MHQRSDEPSGPRRLALAKPSGASYIFGAQPLAPHDAAPSPCSALRRASTGRAISPLPPSAPDGAFAGRELTRLTRTALERVQDVTLDLVFVENETDLEDLHASLLLAGLAVERDAEAVRRAMAARS